MEREILFRGQLKDTKKWVYGCYLKERACDGVLHIIVDEDGEYYPINPKTLCQYVGLTDKNGRKIFEGDFLVYPQFLWYINTYHKCLRVEGLNRQDYKEIASQLYETGKADISNLTAFGLKVYTW